MRNGAALEALFPNLKSGTYSITSDQADRPNCLGWALYSSLYFDPVGIGGGVSGYYWPDGVPADDSLDAWTALFSLFGYEICENADLEEGTEKIAIYADSAGEPAHVARQQASGVWTSKLNKLEDIDHATLEALLRVPEYVTIVRIMRRHRST